jgi:glutamine amidotransferase
MIGILNYGVGNIKAIEKVFKHLGVPAVILKKPEEVKNVEKLILPGVGAFDYAMQKFSNSGFKEVVLERVQNEEVPILGICVGMQMLAHNSEEGELPGLGLVPGTVKKFSQDFSKFPAPHMGWNEVSPFSKNSSLFKGLETPRFYFLHSYYFECKKSENELASCTYEKKFVCAVQNKNIFGVQFHPEKSHHFGVRLIENFSIL